MGLQRIHIDAGGNVAEIDIFQVGLCGYKAILRLGIS